MKNKTQFKSALVILLVFAILFSAQHQIVVYDCGVNIQRGDAPNIIESFKGWDIIDPEIMDLVEDGDSFPTGEWKRQGAVAVNLENYCERIK